MPAGTNSANLELFEEVHIGPFYKHGLTLIQAWMSNHTHSEMWGEITYPFPNFNVSTVEVWEWISDFF